MFILFPSTCSGTATYWFILPKLAKHWQYTLEEEKKLYIYKMNSSQYFIDLLELPSSIHQFSWIKWIPWMGWCHQLDGGMNGFGQIFFHWIENEISWMLEMKSVVWMILFVTICTVQYTQILGWNELSILHRYRPALNWFWIC